MNRRGFLAAAGAAVPAAAWAGRTDESTPRPAPPADLPLRSPAIRVALLHAEVPAIDSRFADSDRAALTARWLSDIERLAGAADKPDVILLPDFALTGWDHWTGRQLRTVAARVDGPELDRLCEAASRFDLHVLLGGWWRSRTAAAAPQHRTLLLTPARGPQPMVAGIWRTAIGNWAVSDGTPDQAADKALATTGAECLVATGPNPTTGGHGPWFRITLGRAAGALPPGCPAVIGAEPPFQSRAVDADRTLLACSVGHGPQTLMFTVPIGALRAARLRAAAPASAAGHILG